MLLLEEVLPVAHQGLELHEPRGQGLGGPQGLGPGQGDAGQGRGVGPVSLVPVAHTYPEGLGLDWVDQAHGEVSGLQELEEGEVIRNPSEAFP